MKVSVSVFVCLLSSLFLVVSPQRLVRWDCVSLRRFRNCLRAGVGDTGDADADATVAADDGLNERRREGLMRGCGSPKNGNKNKSRTSRVSACRVRAQAIKTHTPLLLSLLSSSPDLQERHRKMKRKKQESAHGVKTRKRFVRKPSVENRLRPSGTTFVTMRESTFYGTPRETSKPVLFSHITT